MHDNSMQQARSFVDGLLIQFADRPLRIADVGSLDINGCYRNLFNRPQWEYVGFDIRDGKNVDVVLTLKNYTQWVFPVAHHEQFDVVISGQCMEHVAEPWLWIQDVASLCKPGGLIWLAVPNTEVFHEHPIDAWRVWPDGMRGVFRAADLTEVFCRAVGPDTIGLARKKCLET